MTHVRRHQRITRGRAVSVRSHERAIPERHGADTVWDDGSWQDTSSSTDCSWDDQEQGWAEPDEPAGTGTEDQPPAGDPPGTWHFRSHGKLYAAWPDGTAHLVPEDEPGPALDDEGIRPPGDTGRKPWNRAQDCALPPDYRDMADRADQAAREGSQEAGSSDGRYWDDEEQAWIVPGSDYPCAMCGGSGASRLGGATCSRCQGNGIDPYANRR